MEEKKVNLEALSTIDPIIQEFKERIALLDKIRVIELPFEWECAHPYKEIIQTFFVTKKVYFDKSVNNCKDIYRDKSLMNTIVSSTHSRTIVVDLIQKPFDCAPDREREERNNWRISLHKDASSQHRKEFFNLEGDWYIMDYDLDKIIDEIERLDESEI